MAVVVLVKKLKSVSIEVRPNRGIKKPFIPNLQDLTLLVFWFGWLFMIVTIVAVRWFSPGGGWKAGSFTMGLMLLVTMCVYALIVQIA